MADLAFPTSTERLAYDVSDLEFTSSQVFEQLDTGYRYVATAPGVGNWKVASGPQSARAETAAPSAGSLPLASFVVPITVVDAIDLIGANGAIVRWASPLAGTLTLFKCVIDGALTTANAVLTGKIGATGITGGVITCTQAGSAAGSVFSATPSALNVLAVGDVLSFTCSGTQDAAKFAKITAMVKPTIS